MINSSVLRRFRFFGSSIICSFFVLLSCLHSDLSAQPLDLSSRVGERIDDDEQRYFNLFTGIGGFSSARLERSGSDSVRIVVSRTDGGDTVLTRSDSTIAALRLAIENYEDLFTGSRNMVDWTRLEGLISPNSPLGEEPLSLVVTTASGEVRGTVLLADSLYLAIAPDDLARDWPRLGEHARIFTPDEILRVHLERSGLPALFHEFDIPVSGNDTIYRRELVPALANRSIFYRVPSPELRRGIDRRMAGSRGERRPLASVEQIDEQLALPLVTVAVGLAGRLDIGFRGFDIMLYGGDQMRRLVSLPAVSIGRVKAEYDPLPFLRLGISYFSYDDPAIPEDVGDDYQRIHHASAAEVSARIVLMRHRAIFAHLRDRLELSVGGALIRSWFDIESRVTSSPFGSTYHQMFHDARSVDGGAVMVGCAFWLRKFLSLEAEVKFSTFGEFDIEEMSLPSRTGIFTLKTHQSHSLAINAVDMGLWLRFHF